MGVDKMGVDEMGVDEMGVDEMGVDEMGTHPCLHTFWHTIPTSYTFNAFKSCEYLIR